jgi:hypothetical protein|tara:strand:+ start:27574 stop:27762 length:189 start_codon:yes stop_codon:yes gene_type:complete
LVLQLETEENKKVKSLVEKMKEEMAFMNDEDSALYLQLCLDEIFKLIRKKLVLKHSSDSEPQ